MTGDAIPRTLGTLWRGRNCPKAPEALIFSYLFFLSRSEVMKFFLHNYGKSPFLMGKSTISMVIFNSYVKLPEDISPYHGTFWLRNRCLGSLFWIFNWLHTFAAQQEHPFSCVPGAGSWVSLWSFRFWSTSVVGVSICNFSFLPGETMENDDWLVVPCFCVFNHGHGMMITTKKNTRGLNPPTRSNQYQSFRSLEIEEFLHATNMTSTNKYS